MSSQSAALEANNRDPVRVLIADDHHIVRDGIRMVLSLEADIEVVGEAADGLEAVRQAAASSPDVICIDLAMPRMSGADAIGEIKKRTPDIRIVVLTAQLTRRFVSEAMAAGSHAIVAKDGSSADLTAAIRSVVAGKRFFSRQIETLVDTIDQPAAGPLTPRERQILKLVAEGATNQQIAGHLGISVRTVDKHRENLMRKLDLHSVAELTAYAVREEII